MTSSTPAQPMTLPASAAGWADWLTRHADDELKTARQGADQLKASPPVAALDILGAWNDISIALDNAASAGSLLSQVHPDEAIRSQAEMSVQAAQSLSTDLGLDRGLYDLLSAIDPADLDADAARLLRLTLRDFTRSGVDQDETDRQRLRELADRETQLGQEFSKNIRDDVRRVEVTSAQLDGLPADYIEAHPPNADGRHEITTDYPDINPLLAFGTDAGIRRRLHIEFLNRGWPANDVLLQELLTLRAEHAALLGYDDWADFDAEVKMIGSGAAISDFIDRIATAAAEPGRRDRDVLLARLQQDRPDAATIDRADATYYAELVRREQFDVDAQTVRTYFDFTKVREGLLSVTHLLFGLEYVEATDAPRWHDDVTAYDVRLDGEHLGRIYLDLHPRDGKFKHAAQFTLAGGIADRQLPEGVLVCNFPRGLMEHSDVVTLFHEFGHLVHHVLAGRQQWVRFSGVATEWDFVEAPSQLLEEWAWDAGVLQTFATNAADEPIPAELVAKMRAAQDFGKGYFARTQMFYAAVSYALHHARAGNLTDVVKRLQAEYDLFPYVEGTHFQASFGHLVGYTSAYYTYMWSLVIAKDLLSAFDADNRSNPAPARRYRDTILARGGSRDAADLVSEFLGRPYNFDAFAGWLDEAPGA